MVLKTEGNLKEKEGPKGKSMGKPDPKFVKEQAADNDRINNHVDNILCKSLQY